ncbi:MBL fold metallo-hydrolase [Thermus islandicus]|uniref:MBL fold metallo-hydrolase n=1 Tax=Thermus islandicus TaxID=540988 RepID=UPI0003B5254C|nr:MBL fold metallo-hydrolase [Thermus islandicus]
MRRFDLGGLRVHVFGGWGEIGGNQLLLEAEEGALLLDFGRPFARWSAYFTEFLSPRTASLGLRDLLYLGLLPPLPGLYRQGPEDTLFPSDLERNLLGGDLPSGEKVLALLLSHAHLDHTGAVGYLRQDLPVVATAATAALVKAMQDTAQVGVDGEAAYLTPRRPNPDKGGLLDGDRTLYLRRPYRVLGALGKFHERSPSGKKLQGHPWEEARAPLPLGPFRVEAFPVDHSVPGAAAFAVETPEGRVVYTGDLRRHGRWGARTEAFLGSLESLEVFLLVVEGTRLGEARRARTEGEVKEALHREVAQWEGCPVVVDFAPRNLERLLSCLEVARDVGRKLVVTPKDAYLLFGLAEAEPDPWKGVLQEVMVLKEEKNRTGAWEKALQDEAGLQWVALKEVAQDPGAYLLALGFYEVNRLLDLRLLEAALGGKARRGAYLFTNSYWADQEQILDLEVLLAWLGRLDFRLLPEGLAKLPRDPAGVENPFHTSGHAPEPDLLEAVRRLRPRYLLPVHTERPERWRELYREGEVLLL